MYGENDMSREYLRKEGLFLTGVEDNFFESCLQSQNGLEAKIDEIAEKVDIALKDTQENIWHCIFEVTLKEVFEYSIGEYLQLNQYTAYHKLKNILAEFYKDPFFFEIGCSSKGIIQLAEIR